MSSYITKGSPASAGPDMSAPMTKGAEALPGIGARQLADYAIRWCMGWDEARPIYDALMFCAEGDARIRAEALRIKEHYLRQRDDAALRTVIMSGAGATYNDF